MDTFVFNDPIGATNVDTVGDFQSGFDKIELDDDIFGALLGQSFLNADRFVANAAGTAMSGSHLIIFNTTTGALYYDQDGNGGGFSAIQVAFVLDNLGAPAALTADDFIVVS